MWNLELPLKQLRSQLSDGHPKHDTFVLRVHANTGPAFTCFFTSKECSASMAKPSISVVKRVTCSLQPAMEDRDQI